jgi:hypothetical protein
LKHARIEFQGLPLILTNRGDQHETSLGATRSTPVEFNTDSVFARIQSPEGGSTMSDQNLPTPQEIIDDLIAKLQQSAATEDFGDKVDALLQAAAAYTVARGHTDPDEGDYDDLPRVLHNLIQDELKLRWPDTEFSKHSD